MSKPSTDPRVCAAQALALLLNRQGSLAHLNDSHLSPRDRSLVRALCFGVCRTLPHLNALASLLLSKPFKTRDQDIQALLLLGLYQLLYMRVPSHAAVGETAGAARALGKHWATNVLNACLRRFQREQSQLETSVMSCPDAVTLHPAWLVETFAQAWPHQLDAIIAANNIPAPMTLRVNLSQLTRNDYLAKLEEAGIDGEPCRFAPAGIRLKSPLDVTALPLFATGGISVQDEAAQLAAPLLYDALPTQRPLRILDACSAPGGKSAHLLELAAQEGRALTVTALDSDAKRLVRVTETLARLGFDKPDQPVQAKVIHGDASQSTWWDGQLFDAILVDAPCSGTGVIRRHPDIKQLRTPEDIKKLCHLQQQIITTLWPMLTPAGSLLYATCSILPQENTQQVAAFLARTQDAAPQMIELPWGIEDPHGTRQRLPGDDDGDGFFYALIRHTPLAK